MGSNNTLEIVTSSGKRYKDFRAYHIAMGMAVRHALIDFYKEVKEYAINKTTEYYNTEFGGSEYYDNTYGMINALASSDDLNGAITYFIKGSYDKNYTFDIGINWEALNAHSNGEGQFGTYTGFDKISVVGEWEDMLERGLPIFPNETRHTQFNIMKIIENYVEKNIEKVINRALQPYR